MTRLPKPKPGPVPLDQCVMTVVRRARPPGRQTDRHKELQRKATNRYHPVEGAIAAFEILSLAEFCRRFKVNRYHLAHMKATGMKFRVEGRYT